jgi:hypothetical protein
LRWSKGIRSPKQGVRGNFVKGNSPQLNLQDIVEFTESSKCWRKWCRHISEGGMDLGTEGMKTFLVSVQHAESLEVPST